MSTGVIVAELSRRKRSIPCADECVTDCPFFQAQSLSECCGMSIGQASFAPPLDSADGGGAESGSVCDVFLRQSRKIPQVGDGPTVFRDDDEAVEGYSQLFGGPGEVVGLRVRSRGFPVVMVVGSTPIARDRSPRVIPAVVRASSRA